MISSAYRGLIYYLLLLILPAVAAAKPVISQIIIVKSSDNGYYNQSITTLTNHLDQNLQYRVIEISDLETQALDLLTNTLFITLGQAAIDAVKDLGEDRELISAYLTQEQFLKTAYQHHAAVLLDQPLDRYLAFIKTIPDIGNVGLITKAPLQLRLAQTELLQKLKVELNQYQLDSRNKLLPVLRQVMRDNDALLMLPRQSIYNRDSLKGVLLTSYRNRKPAISYSPAHVKSGALASIYSSPVDIGRHLAILVNQRIKNPSLTQSRMQFAKFYSIATNSKVARALGIRLPTERDIRAELDRLGL